MQGKSFTLISCYINQGDDGGGGRKFFPLCKPACISRSILETGQQDDKFVSLAAESLVFIHQ